MPNEDDKPVTMPSYTPGDKMIVVKMLDNLTIMNWSFDGSMKVFKKDGLYELPSWVGLELQKQSLCYFVESVK